MGKPEFSGINFTILQHFNIQMYIENPTNKSTLCIFSAVWLICLPWLYEGTWDELHSYWKANFLMVFSRWMKILFALTVLRYFPSYTLSVLYIALWWKGGVGREKVMSRYQFFSPTQNEIFFLSPRYPRRQFLPLHIFLLRENLYHFPEHTLNSTMLS